MSAYRVYCQVSSQYIMGMGGPITLNAASIHSVLDCYEVPYNEDRLELVNKIQAIAAGSIKSQQRESEKKRKQAEADAKAKRR